MEISTAQLIKIRSILRKATPEEKPKYFRSVKFMKWWIEAVEALIKHGYSIEELIEEDEQKPDFDDMMSEVQEEIEEHDAEDAVVSRAPELRKLSENIDKATNTWINATLQQESAIRKYNAAQTVLVNSVDTISGKVGTINEHIDKVLENAPTKLQVSVRVADADWQKIQTMFDNEHKWMTTQMQKHIREVNEMFADERKRVQERYKEYDGTYLGRYSQYFFWFFFVLGLVIFGLVIFLALDAHYHWTK